MRITPILKLTSLLVIFLCLIQTAFTQNKVIAGRVTDPNGTGVPGVTVSVKGTTLSTQTSSDGSFSINAPANATLSFTSVGYTSQDVSVSGKTAVDVTLAAA